MSGCGRLWHRVLHRNAEKLIEPLAVVKFILTYLFSFFGNVWGYVGMWKGFVLRICHLKVAPEVGLEPTTYWLTGTCFIQNCLIL